MCLLFQCYFHSQRHRNIPWLLSRSVVVRHTLSCFAIATHQEGNSIHYLPRNYHHTSKLEVFARHKVFFVLLLGVPRLITKTPLSLCHVSLEAKCHLRA
jgi:hypothetical protein